MAVGCTIQGAPAQTATPSSAPTEASADDDDDDDDDDSSLGAAPTITAVPAQEAAMPASGTSPKTCTDTGC